jgi:hypothetical protein
MASAMAAYMAIVSAFFFWGRLIFIRRICSCLSVRISVKASSSFVTSIPLHGTDQTLKKVRVRLRVSVAILIKKCLSESEIVAIPELESTQVDMDCQYCFLKI